MSNHIHLDPIGGIAGDMFIAAVLDAWTEQKADLIAAIFAAGLPKSIKIDAWRDTDGILAGHRFKVLDNSSSNNEHRHTRFRDIRGKITESKLTPAVAERAMEIFRLLAEAEANVHGTAIDDVTFHEVGAADSIADIVGAAYLIETLAGAQWHCGPLPMGSGRIATAHGVLPLPAPATALLLIGYPVFQDGINGERVTPTGAAILRHLAPEFSTVLPTRRLSKVGVGLGTRTLPGMSNVLRILVSEPLDETTSTDDVAVIQFEVDDQSPEDLAIGLDRLRAQPGVIDVVQVGMLGKKGRMAMQIQALVMTDAVDRIALVCFRETSTIGLRWQIAHRKTLKRRSETIVVDSQTVRVKYVDRPGESMTQKIEADDLADVGDGFADRERLRRKVSGLERKRDE